MAQVREHVLSRAAVVFTSIAQRLHLVGIGRRASFFHEDDCRLGAHLTPLSGCHPVDSVTGDRPNGPVTLDEYRALVTPGVLSPTARTLCERLGINAAAWRTTIDEVGPVPGRGGWQSHVSCGI